MTGHPAPEQLAAFFAGDADESVQTHVRGCARCSADVSAIGRTVAELKALPQPEPSDEDVRTWRGAVERAQTKRTARQPLVWRWVTAAGGVAAVLIGFVAFSGGMNNPGGMDERGGATVQEAAATLQLTPGSVRALIAGPSAAAAAPESDMGAGSTFSTDAAREENVKLASQRSSAACDKEIWGKRKRPAPVVHEGIWKETPAYVLVYRFPERSTAEAWVVSRADCDTLFFAQAKI